MRLFQLSPSHVRNVLVLLFVSAVLLGATGVHAAVVAVATFDDDAEGWSGLACPNPGVCALGSTSLTIEHLAANGNPGGYIRTQDPSSDTAARVAPPVSFSSLFAPGQTLSFDVLVERNGGDGVYGSATAPLVTIETAGGTLVFATGDLPTIDGDWKHYDVPLFEDAGWQLASTSVRPLTPGEFDALFATRTRLTIISEWLNDSADLDTGGLDNITLSAIPLPGALPLLGAALLTLALRRRRPRG